MLSGILYGSPTCLGQGHQEEMDCVGGLARGIVQTGQFFSALTVRHIMTALIYLHIAMSLASCVTRIRVTQ